MTTVASGKMNYTTVSYQDERLSDGTVHRLYDDGYSEWRQREPDGCVTWSNSQGRRGVDTLLDDKLVKRVLDNGAITYGREQGYGRTLWGGATPTLAINRSNFGGHINKILMTVGAGMLMGRLVWPPEVLSEEEEKEIRNAAREKQKRQSQSGDDGGGGDSFYFEDTPYDRYDDDFEGFG